MLAPPRAPAAHILTYAQTMRGGGVERAQLRLAREWIRAGRRVTMVIGDPTGPLSAELPDGLETITLGSASFARLLAAVPGHADRLKPDAIFCPGNHYSSIGIATRLRLGRICPPTLAKVSNTLIRPDQRFPVAQGYRAWLKLHPRFIDHFVAMTRAMAVETAKLMRVDGDRVSIIANPPARPIPGVALPPLPPGRFLLGVGRLAPQKRWERLIAAMTQIADQSVSLMILGEGAERPRLEAQIAALGLGRRVTMPGHANDPLPAIVKAAAVVLVSDFEGVPGVLREALAHGTPVVATDSSVALREIVTGPELGIIVPAGTPRALVAALDHWLSPQSLRPPPVSEIGEHSAAEYLDLLDRLVLQH